MYIYTAFMYIYLYIYIDFVCTCVCTKPRSPELQADSLLSEPPGKPIYIYDIYIYMCVCVCACVCVCMYMYVWLQRVLLQCAGSFVVVCGLLELWCVSSGVWFLEQAV